MKLISMTRAGAVLATVGLVAGAGVAPATADGHEAPTITEIVVSNPGGDFDTLREAVIAAGLADDLDGKRQLTVFAPTDDAFAAAGLTPENVAGAIEADPGIVDILLHHVVPGERFSGDVVASTQLRTLNKDFIPVDAANLEVDGAGLVALDIDASNGVVHVIDAVMLP